MDKKHHYAEKRKSHFWNNKIFFCKDTGEKVHGYSEYLKTKHWKRMRRIVYEQFGGVCCGCGEYFAINETHVHHRSYSNLGNESPKDLVLLCPKCHAKAERNKKKLKKSNNQFRKLCSRMDKELTFREKRELSEYIKRKYHIM